jgi:hypothetical protein
MVKIIYRKKKRETIKIKGTLVETVVQFYFFLWLFPIRNEVKTQEKHRFTDANYIK